MMTLETLLGSWMRVRDVRDQLASARAPRTLSEDVATRARRAQLEDELHQSLACLGAILWDVHDRGLSVDAALSQMLGPPTAVRQTPPAAVQLWPNGATPGDEPTLASVAASGVSNAAPPLVEQRSGEPQGRAVATDPSKALAAPVTPPLAPPTPGPQVAPAPMAHGLEVALWQTEPLAPAQLERRDGAPAEHRPPSVEVGATQDASSVNAAVRPDRGDRHETYRAKVLPPVPVSREELATRVPQLQRHVREGATFRETLAPKVPTDTESWDHATRGVAALGSTPRNLKGKKPVAREVEVLSQVVQGQLEVWRRLPKPLNHALSSWVTARARAVQQSARREKVPGADDRLTRLFHMLSAHSRETQPGSIYGLNTLHMAPGGDWLREARERERALRELIGLVPGDLLDDTVVDGEAQLTEEAPAVAPPNADDLLRRLEEDVRTGMDAAEFAVRAREILQHSSKPAKDPRMLRLAARFADSLEGAPLSPLRKALRRAKKESLLEESTHEATAESALPEGWTPLELTRGRRGVIVGGAPRHESLRRLRQMFQFSELDWHDCSDGNTRRVDSLVERIVNGSVGVVLVMRSLVSHLVSDKVMDAQSHPATLVQMAEGYGEGQIRQALESAWSRRLIASG